MTLNLKVCICDACILTSEEQQVCGYSMPVAPLCRNPYSGFTYAMFGGVTIDANRVWKFTFSSRPVER